jgi:hypothetical protein
MKITLHGFGERRGRKIATEIKKLLRSMPFRYVRGTRILLDLMPDSKPSIVIDGISSGEVSKVCDLALQIKELYPKAETFPEQRININFPKRRLTKREKIISQVCKNNPLWQVADIFEEL